MSFTQGDKVRIKKEKEHDWFCFESVREEYEVIEVQDSSAKTFQILTLDDGSVASGEWFDKIGVIDVSLPNIA